MEKAYKSKMTLAVIAMLCVFTTGIYAEEEQEKGDKGLFEFHWSLGTKGFYSSGISDSYAYNKTNATGGISSEYIDASVFIQRYFHYQLTDGNGEYEYASFNEAGISLTAHLFANIFNLTGEYNCADDFNNLKRNIYTGIIEFDFSPVILTGDYSYEKFEYEMNSVTVENIKRDYSFQAEYSISDAVSTDLGYSRSELDFESLDSSYAKNIFRLGLSAMPSKYFFLMGGASLGKDSADYYIYGADFGITVKPYTHIKFSLTYNFSYYNPPSTDSSKKSGGSGSGGSGNPLLTADKAGDSYYSQVVSLGMTLAF
jgi:hypothetical protein